MKSILHFLAILFVFMIGVSCSNADDPPPDPVVLSTNPTSSIGHVSTSSDSYFFSTDSSSVILTFKTILKPGSDDTSMATGNATLQFNQTTKKIEIYIIFSGLKPGLAYIHGADGAIVFNLFPERYIAPYSNPLDEGDWSPIPSPIHYISAITDDQIKELMANHYYIDLRTMAYPNGEISGTLIQNNGG